MQLTCQRPLWWCSSSGLFACCLLRSRGFHQKFCRDQGRRRSRGTPTCLLPHRRPRLAKNIFDFHLNWQGKPCECAPSNQCRCPAEATHARAGKLSCRLPQCQQALSCYWIWLINLEIGEINRINYRESREGKECALKNSKVDVLYSHLALTREVFLLKVAEK